VQFLGEDFGRRLDRNMPTFEVMGPEGCRRQARGVQKVDLAFRPLDFDVVARALETLGQRFDRGIAACSKKMSMS
jgi:hypothetical protein